MIPGSKPEAVSSRLRPAPSPSLPAAVFRTVLIIPANAVTIYGVMRLGWNAAALIILFILEGFIVFSTDLVRYLFESGRKDMKGVPAVEFFFLAFYGFFALLVFGPYPSLEALIVDRMSLVTAIIFHDLPPALGAAALARWSGLAQELFAAGKFGGGEKKPLRLQGGTWMILLFLAVMTAPLITRGGPNPSGGLIALVGFKTLWELAETWVSRLLPKAAARG